MQGLKSFFAGFMTCALIAALMFANALYSGTLTRGETVQNIESYLPSVVREMPFKKANSDRIEQLIARQP